MASKKKQQEEKQNKKNVEELKMFDKAARSIFSILDNSYNDREVLNSKDQKFRSILNRELEISKGVSQGSIVDFVSSVRVKNQIDIKNGEGQNNQPDTNELFTKNINDIFGYFQDMYRNRFIEMGDLKFISKFIPALGEAIKTILDSVVSADNVAEAVNRRIDLPSSVSENDAIAIRNEIERNEKELKLLKKLKNIVYKKALVTGNYYVYAVSYNRIFEEYDKIKKREKQQEPTMSAQFSSNNRSNKKKNAMESFVIGDVDISPAMESVRDLLSTEGKLKDNDIKDIMQKCHDELPVITCDDSTIYFEAMESARCIANNPIAMEALKKNTVKENPITGANHPIELKMPDGTKDINKSVKPDTFNIPGTYIKYIDPKNIVPLKVFDQKIGYYLIHPKQKTNKTSAGEITGINSIGTTLFSAVNVGEEKKHDAVERIVNSIADGIMQNFNSKFVSQNAEYKKVIADCIIANGLTNKDYNIQFIPVDDIIEFTVNENEDGYGESVLNDSLFPAKLLLSTMVCRLLNYINKSGNKTIAHIYKGPVGTFTSNQINRVIRDIQEQNVTFNDLLSPNLVFNKFNRDGNLSIPTAKNGNHLVEFETQEGQNVDMSPEYEKELEKMAILGTGVPSTIMEYVDNVDFAKQVVSANIKFAGRVATLQSDLEEPTTLLYKKICMNSNLTDEQKTLCAESLEFKLPRPRVLSNSNNGEFIQSVVGTAEALADIIIGRESVSNTEVLKNGQQLKEKLMLEIVKKDAPFIDWDELEEYYEKIKIQLVDDPEENSDSTDNNGGF